MPAAQRINARRIKVSERDRATWQERLASRLEPGETVRYSLMSLGRPWWLHWACTIPPVGLVLNQARAPMKHMVVTDRSVYIFTLHPFRRSIETLFEGPLGGTSARIGGSGFPGRYLMIGDQRLWLAGVRWARDLAEVTADAVAHGPSALPPPNPPTPPAD
jgi:hypothetical protein